MQIIPIKTEKIKTNSKSLTDFLDIYIQNLQESNIIAITSKVISILENSVMDKTINKNELIKKEADYYIDPINKNSPIILTLKNNTIVPFAGIDESNSNGKYILYPNDPQKTVNLIWNYLKTKFKLKKLGIIITDSSPLPMKTGVIGIPVAHCGFEAIKKCIGKKDIFGAKLKMTSINVLQALATTSVFIMGETNEQTPLAIIKNSPHIIFKDNVPTIEELKLINININEDLFNPMLQNLNWKSKKETKQ